MSLWTLAFPSTMAAGTSASESGCTCSGWMNCLILCPSGFQTGKSFGSSAWSNRHRKFSPGCWTKCDHGEQMHGLLVGCCRLEASLTPVGRSWGRIWRYPAQAVGCQTSQRACNCRWSKTCQACQLYCWARSLCVRFHTLPRWDPSRSSVLGRLSSLLRSHEAPRLCLLSLLHSNFSQIRDRV